MEGTELPKAPRCLRVELVMFKFKSYLIDCEEEEFIFQKRNTPKPSPVPKIRNVDENQKVRSLLVAGPSASIPSPTVESQCPVSSPAIAPLVLSSHLEANTKCLRLSCPSSKPNKNAGENGSSEFVGKSKYDFSSVSRTKSPEQVEELCQVFQLLDFYP